MLETLHMVIAQLTSDLGQCVDSAWAVSFGPDPWPLYTFGRHPDRDRCAAYIAGVLAEPPAGSVDSAHERPYHHDGAASITCPVRVHGETLAFVGFGPKNTGEAYSSSDRDLIAGLTTHVSGLMSDCRLATIVGRKIEHMRRTEAELESARQVQHRFFPFRLPPIKGLDYHGECHQVGEVGGDFFDFIAGDSSSLLLSIGDVSGKGVPAAIVMAGLQASVRALGTSGCNRLSALVCDLNRMVWQLSPENFYATMFYARIDTARRELQYVNAGHEAPLLVRQTAKAVVRLESTGTVLGLSKRSAFEQKTVPFHPGDVLVAVTDGVSDALYSEGCDLYREVVLAVVRDHPDASSSDLTGHIIRAVDTSADGAAADDKTVVVVRFVEAAMGAVISRPLRNHAFAHAAMAS